MIHDERKGNVGRCSIYLTVQIHKAVKSELLHKSGSERQRSGWFQFCLCYIIVCDIGDLTCLFMKKGLFHKQTSLGIEMKSLGLVSVIIYLSDTIVKFSDLKTLYKSFKMYSIPWEIMISYSLQEVMNSISEKNRTHLLKHTNIS